ncbi:BspA family leucine-rich repeat surface protein [uncultured Methanobrevibacter sp.]|uniref:BspA family leucine-rich repeat surface protein n=1 Tax=uncultured Methanobrevibacter sp. TaxID=253161 RepID=UPI0025F52454|nr:BspA family leucine-rich repeat surface protein [uncultured Methanobrevibacter sp.]
MGLFDKLRTPKWKHEDWKVRLEAVEKLDDEKILIDIAKNDSDSDVRKEAVKKISDESALAYVAKYDESCYVRSSAVEKISDESVLSYVAKKDSDSNVRKEAVKKISDESALAYVAKYDESCYVRSSAVEKISDESVLSYVAKKDSDSDVRKEAVKKISDESVLSYVAKKDSDSNVRLECSKKIKNKVVLVDIAHKAVARSDDKDSVWGDDADDCRFILGLIDDESFLIDIAKNHSSKWVRREAIDCIKDLNPNSIIFTSKSNISRINEESKLKDIAKMSPDDNVRKQAIKMINDESFLMDVAKADSNEDIRREAIKNISKTNSPQIINTVMKKLDNEEFSSKSDFKIYLEKAIDIQNQKKNMEQFVKNSSNYYDVDLKMFESFNITTSSIYNLEDFDVLIILKDRTNLTNWDDVEDISSIIYISENVSRYTNLNSKYFSEFIESSEKYDDYYLDNKRTCSIEVTDCGNRFKNVKAIVAQNVTNNIKDLNSMFKGCVSLKTVSGLETWDTRNVKTMEDMFAGCENLEKINGIDKIRTDNLKNKSNIFGTYSVNVDRDDVFNDDRYKVDGFKVTCKTSFKCLKITDDSVLADIDKTPKNEISNSVFDYCENCFSDIPQGSEYCPVCGSINIKRN